MGQLAKQGCWTALFW